MNSINLNYIRGLYDFLFGKSDEELEELDINLPKNQRILFEEMAKSFNRFGPTSKKNILDGLNLIFHNSRNEELWRNAIPHDLPLNRVMDRQGYLEGVIFALTKNPPALLDEQKSILIDEIGSHGLDFSK